MKRLNLFLRQYKQFSITVLTVLIGLVLQFTGNAIIAQWLLSIVAILMALPLVYDMTQDVRSGKYGIDILAVTAIVAAVVLGEYWAAIVVVLMLTGGESLEDYAHNRAKSELNALLEHAPQKARVLRKGKTTIVPVSELRVGDKILINAGDLVPVDAVVLEGTASFDEASLTGESLPQTKQKGDNLLSGSINQDGAITAKAIATAEDSQYQQIIKLVKSAANSQAPFVRLAERYSLPFTIFAYALATTVWVVSGNPDRFLEVIIVATPCPLLLAAPIALISGMARASKYGIIVKTGSALEKMAEAKTIAFDKTGTLTKGELVVDDIAVFNKFSKDQILSFAAGLEQGSNHVVAQAIIEASQKSKIKPVKVKQIKEIPGQGLKATVKGEPIIMGRLKLIQEEGIKLPSKVKLSGVDKTAVYVAVGDQLAGIIMLSDELRPEAVYTLESLHELGLKDTMLVTGDNRMIAQNIAKRLSISEVYAEALPVDKINMLDKVKQRPLVFVGDGVNDAPILTAADVGIAMGARGSTAASESADMVIMVNDLSRVAAAYEIAKRTFSIARTSILIGIGLSILLMLAFATGRFSALTGALLQELVDVFVIFYALRAHLIKPAEFTKLEE